MTMFKNHKHSRHITVTRTGNTTTDINVNEDSSDYSDYDAVSENRRETLHALTTTALIDLIWTAQVTPALIMINDSNVQSA